MVILAAPATKTAYLERMTSEEPLIQNLLRRDQKETNRKCDDEDEVRDEAYMTTKSQKGSGKEKDFHTVDKEQCVDHRLFPWG